ncbi:hypothetical protein MBM_00702 [Drepanopeziza brunnea f. sp. 'multigermtubi' MB_m1]|uniref:Uncharacterized protein n=1 Tax=Marssonina brunnea f. sp. multigermtubi (strain MB_m1) TaxID=1072389 RepID=K1Y8W8_MARBU|nr:uncharacterized protein MBM_00702 [Drepanopeziza brunnea f. sp. 'multigermtubi' MB_m1]EKD21589.1 hypothetical protein MBM_00702 [Drepanopeziza brunnea f. sp. 'multigermtubi' MB_m1]
MSIRLPLLVCRVSAEQINKTRLDTIRGAFTREIHVGLSKKVRIAITLVSLPVRTAETVQASGGIRRGSRYASGKTGCCLFCRPVANQTAEDVASAPDAKTVLEDAARCCAWSVEARLACAAGSLCEESSVELRTANSDVGSYGRGYDGRAKISLRMPILEGYEVLRSASLRFGFQLSTFRSGQATYVVIALVRASRGRNNMESKRIQ